ncbi:hypothetical protein D9611_013288 [Ephemerocybe angulata]|uniref:Transcription factor CBF/NF-Y/archaeal histone domain-containing protein n=1 Tax=Ephemerocybe angulata TaxID=980116 RepID=A0A8H5CB29_9AGAR|nr:hypothetical protein D9611_013288 [Tulosesus angulatus]
MSAQQQPPPFVQSGEPLNQFLKSFWQRQIDSAEKETPDYRHPPLPLARIKKVMKSDPDVKMIAADVFISEITARAFIIADSNKRRTLSRADIAKALSKSDQFDFLIDIVPREDLPFPGTSTSNGGNGKKNANIAAPKANQTPPALEGSNGLELENGEAGTGGSIDQQLESLLGPPQTSERGSHS